MKLTEIYCNRPLITDSTKFRKKTEILRKWANSAARLQIPCSVENCGLY